MEKNSQLLLRGLNITGQLIVLSILWTVCCLPVVTIGASSTALYYTVVKAVRRERGSLLSCFLSCLRENFWQSLYVNLCYLAGFAVLALASLPRLVHSDVPYVALGLAFALLIPFSFTFPVLSRFYHRGGALARFLLLLTGKYLYAGVLCAALILLGGALVLANGAFLIIVPGLYAYIQSLMLEPVFRKHSDQSDQAPYDLWYGDGNEE